jgi:peptide/nickel transport system substrate-binding protein
MIIAVAATLSGCVSAPRVVKDSSITVAAPASFTSYNPSTSYGATELNQQVAYATNSNFEYFDAHSKLVPDTSFGTVQLLSKSPLRVRYTVNQGVTWSDGVRVDAADLMLAWAANSGALNSPGFDPKPYVMRDGRFASNFPSNEVWFDAQSTNGLDDATSVPKLGKDGRSITLTYSHYFVDWRSAFSVGLPAHIVTRAALDLTSASRAKAATIRAITTDDTGALASMANTWNSGFNVANGRVSDALLVGDGPYVASSATGSTVTLTANKRYSGDHKPRIQSIVVRAVPDAKTAVADLAKGTVDVITPPASASIAKALLDVDGITVAAGYDSSFEHLDLQFAHSKSGYFADPRIREAFLKVIPRKQIVSTVATGVREDTAPRSSFVLFPGTETYQDVVGRNGSGAYAAVDVPGAMRLLREAGAPTPTVCILYDPANPVRVTEFGLIKAEAGKAGFNVTDCSSPDWSTRLGQKGAYDASLFGTRSASSAVTEMVPRLHSGPSGSNDNFYASAAMDTLLDTLTRTSNLDERTQLLTEIDRQLFADAYGLPLFQQPSLTAFRSTVKGIDRSPFAPGVFWNIWEWRPTG